MENSKLVHLDALDKIAKELRRKALADISQQEEEIEKVRDMFGGKSFRYVLQEEYDNLSEEEKNDPYIVWCILDAEDCFSGDYNDLTNKPVIPSIQGLASEAYVDNNIKTVSDELAKQMDQNVSGSLANGIIQAFDAISTDRGRLNNHDAKIAHFESQLSIINGEGVGSIKKAVSDLVDAAPTTLDTLNELAQALGDDPNFATTIANQIGQKADKSELFSGDYNDLTNKPEIPNIEGLASESYVNQQINNIVHPTYDDTGIKSQLANKADKMIYTHRKKEFNKIVSTSTTYPKSDYEFEGRMEFVVGRLYRIEMYNSNGDIFTYDCVSEEMTNGNGDISKGLKISGNVMTEGQWYVDEAVDVNNTNRDYSNLILSIMGFNTVPIAQYPMEKIVISEIEEVTTEFFELNKTITEEEKENWNNKADRSELFSGSYNDLSNKPEIPSIEGLATEELVNNLNNNVVESINEIDTELETKASTEFVNNMLSGLRLVQMTQSEYDALPERDSSTLYIII
jgi:hypothetical protein